mmetsp:Transcript_113462/g.321077  ORF Transcript_113462/g.321077 Transcript_113462/m.321077 type:complete len:350 (+) Transcript_113462:108-1157(+)
MGAAGSEEAAPSTGVEVNDKAQVETKVKLADEDRSAPESRPVKLETTLPATPGGAPVLLGQAFGSRNQVEMGGESVLEVFGYCPVGVNGCHIPDASPFVHKLYAYLALAEVPFILPEKKPTPPKGKYPFVRFHTGELLGDSQLIIEALEERRPPDARLDAWLSADQRAASHMARRLCEESLYWNMIIETRWRNEENFQSMTKPTLYRPLFEGLLPRAALILTPLVTNMVRGDILKGFKGHGYGRHTSSEVAKLAVDDLRALEALLSGSGPFFHGQRPCTVDATLYAFASGIRLNLAAFELCDESAERFFERACPKLSAQCEAMDGLLSDKIWAVVSPRSSPSAALEAAE